MIKQSIERVAVLVIVVILLIATQSIAFAERTPFLFTPGLNARIPVKQIFSTNVLNVNEKFIYTLATQTEGAPMPKGSEKGEYTFQLDGNTSTELKIEMRQVGVYTYKLFQRVENAQENYTYDKAVYRVVIDVYMGSQSQPLVLVVIHNETGAKVPDADFHNRYEKKGPTSPPANGGNVQTGDENNVAGYLIMMVVSALGLVALVIWIRRKDDKQKREANYEK